VAATPLSKRLAHLAKTYSVAHIEAAVVQEFLAQRGLTTRSKLLLGLAERDLDSTGPVRDAIRSIAPVLDIDTVLRVFEMAIPAEDRDLNGAIYTPRNVTDYICERTLVRGDEIVVDPSCGAGAFLIAIARRLATVSGQPMGDIIERQIIGRDILPYSIDHARIMLALLALDAGDDRETLADGLGAGDALAPEWRAAIAQAGGVDAVVGNPPYIRFQELPSEVREHLSTAEWKTTGAGNFNLYFAFFELGLGLLNERGRLGYITPNAHFATKSARELRVLLASGGLTEIIDCGNVSLFEVATYTAITFLAKQSGPTFTFARLDREEDKDRLGSIRRTALSASDLHSDHWLLGYPDEIAMLRAIEKCGTPLVRIANLTVGLATLRDGLYLLGTPKLIDDKYRVTRDGVTYDIEAALTRLCVKVSEHRNQASLDATETRILFPYREDGDGNVIVVDEKTMADQYPGALSYLLSIREELRKRDHGKKTYEAWYAFGRRQGLSVAGRGQLLTPIYAGSPRFLIDPIPGRRFVSGYAVVPRTDQPLGRIWATPTGLRALRNILESDAMAAFVRLTSAPLAGGYRCYAGNYIAPFGIPAMSTEEVAVVASMTRGEVLDWYASKSGIDASVFTRLTGNESEEAA
jgi:hypothetical protein